MENINKVPAVAGSEPEVDTLPADTQALIQDNAVFIEPSELTAVINPIKPILSLEDLLVEEDATAAGLEAGDAGHSFVDLLRVVEAVPGAEYGFPTNPTGTPPKIIGESGVEVTESNVTTTTTVKEPTNPGNPPVEPLPTPDEPNPPGPDVTHGNNGWGNGDQTPPGNSGDHNNAENNTSGTSDPSHGNNAGSGSGSSGSNNDSSNGSTNGNSGGSQGGTETPGGNSEENTGGPKGNNGFGNGDQEAPGNSLNHNNAENAGGTSAISDEYHGNSLHINDIVHNEPTNNGNGHDIGLLVDLITQETGKNHIG